MIETKTDSPIGNVSLELYNSNGSERIVIKNDILYLDNRFDPDYHHKIENMVGKKLKCQYVDPYPVCSECGSEKFTKHYLDSRNLNKTHEVYVTAYKCRKCNKIHRTSLDYFVETHCTYTRDIKETGIKINYFEHMSLNNISLFIESTTDACPCRQTILHVLRRYYAKLKIKNTRQKVFSVNYGYDEQ